jgi:hypothetical protein
VQRLKAALLWVFIESSKYVAWLLFAVYGAHFASRAIASGSLPTSFREATDAAVIIAATSAFRGVVYLGLLLVMSWLPRLYFRLLAVTGAALINPLLPHLLALGPVAFSSILLGAHIGFGATVRQPLRHGGGEDLERAPDW